MFQDKYYVATVRDYQKKSLIFGNAIIFQLPKSFLKIGSVEDNVEDKTSLFDITFEKGVMKIPCFAIEDTMETFMRNMIAFEQHTSKNYILFSRTMHI